MHMPRPTLKPHPADHELLLCLDSGEPRAASGAVDRHLDDCVACRTRLDDLRATLERAIGACQRRDDHDEHDAHDAWAMSALRARVAQTLDAMPTPRPWWQSLSAAMLPFSAVAVATAAVIMLLAPSTTWLRARADSSDRPAIARELPVASLTPGAASSLASSELCDGRRPSRVVAADVRRAVLVTYGMEDVPEDEYELDALITPELGGTTDARNLWPQRYASLVWHARVKDVLEERLAADVCAGRVELTRAQRDLATDWVAAYRRYFNTDVPLRAHLELESGIEEPELEIAPPSSPRIGAHAAALAMLALPGHHPQWSVVPAAVTVTARASY